MAASLNSTDSPLAVFRFDASPLTGAGHAVRCLALADALAASGWRCALASGAAASAVVPALERCGHEPASGTSSMPRRSLAAIPAIRSRTS